MEFSENDKHNKKYLPPEPISKSQQSFEILFYLISYEVFCFFSWVVIKLAEEWHFVEKYDDALKGLNKIGVLLVQAYNFVNIPNFLYEEFFKTHTFTTIIITMIIGFKVWNDMKKFDF